MKSHFTKFILFSLVLCVLLIVFRTQSSKRDDVISQWSTPIAFYGKVIDENGKAVAGANVDLSANDLSIDGRSTYNKVSDDNGLFSIDRIRGKFLHVRVSKMGYQPSKLDQFTFSYAGGDTDQIKPDAHNPVPFHLYKIMGVNADATPCSLPIKLPIEGSLVGIDLSSGVGGKRATRPQLQVKQP